MKKPRNFYKDQMDSLDVFGTFIYGQDEGKAFASAASLCNDYSRKRNNVILYIAERVDKQVIIKRIR